jgi:hypothetical protein
LVKLTTAAFAAEYAGILVRGTTALREAKFTMKPLRRSSIPREKTREGRTVPKKGPAQGSPGSGHGHRLSLQVKIA